MPPTSNYDSVPYESLAFPQSHPAHLATVAALFGMEPCSPYHARVLEVGCAGGGNLLPLATAYPNSEFVGIDISPVQISRAQECVDAVGFRNVKLLARGLEGLDAATAGGTFDYIIAHGVYSWVDASVREELMALCARLLNSNGIAYISFNILPGARTRQTLREILNFHTRVRPGADLPLADRIRQARELFSVLGEAFESRETDPYACLLMGELSHAAANGDFYLAHEHLEETNDPCYFHEFMAHARRHGLQFLGDAEMQAMATGDFPLSVRNSLRAMASNVEEAEQYNDFIRNRAFRQTLLCRQDLPLKRGVTLELMERFHFASSLRPTDESADECRQFRDASGASLEIVDPLTRAALLELQSVWPAALSFSALLEKAAPRAGASPDPRLIPTLAKALLTCYSASRGMEVHLYPPAFRTTVSRHPCAPPLIRWQAAHHSWVTNLRHENLALSPQDRAFLHKVDGTRTVDALSKEGPNIPEVLQHFASLALLAS